MGWGRLAWGRGGRCTLIFIFVFSITIKYFRKVFVWPMYMFFQLLLMIFLMIEKMVFIPFSYIVLSGGKMTNVI